MATQASVTLSAPYTVFPLSLPLHQTRAKDREGTSYRACYTAPVESRKNQKKRKRNSKYLELATAVDGEGVNVYDVRSTKTITSYALQPTTTFSCAPASSVLRKPKEGTLRRTYASTIAPKRELIYWEEFIKVDMAGTPVRRLSRTIGPKEDIIYIQDLSREQGEETDNSGLLAVFAGGHVRFFSEDLQDQRWDFELQKTEKTGPTKVVYAASTTIANARKAIFKNRPGLGLLSEGVESTEIALLLVTQSGNGSTFYVHVLSVPTTVTESHSGPKDHLCVKLPVLEESSKSPSSTFSTHFSTGTLYRLSTDRLVTYNLSLETPSVVTTLPIPSLKKSNTHPTSLLRISSSTVLVATNEDVSLYDTKYSSLQARVPIQSSTPSRKSAALAPANINSIYLTTYMQDMDLAIGYSQSGIVGIQFSRTRPGPEKEKGSLLIDSLCRGIRGLESNTTTVKKPTGPGSALVERQAKQKRQAEETIKKLTDAKESGDVTIFETLFLGYVGYQLPTKADEDSAMVNGVDSMEIVKRNEMVADITIDIPESAHKPLRIDFITSVLSLIFTLVKSESLDKEDRMEISFFAPITLRYLLESGNFSTLYLPLREGLVQALITFDPTLRNLQWFLSSLSELSVSEIMRAVDLALSPPSSLKDQDNVIFEIHRTEVLRTALIRLANLPTSIILKAFKALPSETLIALISLLEIELITGEDGYDEPARTIGIEDMQIVAELLTAAVDAMGMSGMLLTETNEMLTALGKDVDDALLVVEEAASLKCLLEEMFQHVNWATLEAEETSTTAATRTTIVPTRSSNKKAMQKVLEIIPEPTDSDQRKIEKAKKKKQRREERKKARTTGILAPPPPPPPPPPQALVPAPRKKTASVPRISKRRDIVGKKRNRARATAAGHKELLAKINKRRKKIVGHKKMLGQSGLTRKELIKQDRPMPLSAIKRESPILPLGAIALRRLVDPLVGIEFRVDGVDTQDVKKAVRMKREYWREGLAAGVYSVETMVV